MGNIDNLNLKVQLAVLILSIILYILYRLDFFKNIKYNKLALAFSIVNFLWFLSIFFRNQMEKALIKIPDTGIIFSVPMEVKCMIGERYCQNGNIDVWSIFHLIIYICVGFYIPDLYLEILGISFFCEIFENILGFTSKFIIDPCTNVIGYFIGSTLHHAYYNK